jgi:hypothetical protein
MSFSLTLSRDLDEFVLLLHFLVGTNIAIHRELILGYLQDVEALNFFLPS